VASKMMVTLSFCEANTGSNDICAYAELLSRSAETIVKNLNMALYSNLA